MTPRFSWVSNATYGTCSETMRYIVGKHYKQQNIRTYVCWLVSSMFSLKIWYFSGLIFDLFPALDVPRKRDQEFERTVKQAANDMLLQPEDNFILKVVQLEELLEVRHSVFIVGNAGTGKTQVWKTLFKSYQNDNKKPIYNDLKWVSNYTQNLFRSCLSNSYWYAFYSQPQSR